MYWKENVTRLKIEIPVIYLVMKDPATPVCAKLSAAVTIVYALSPIDLIPDFIPVLGYLDDVFILPLLIALTLKLIPKALYEKHRETASQLWKDGKPKHWIFALPFLICWLLLAIFLAKLCL